MDTFIIRKGDKEWRITGEGLCFGKRVKPGAPLHDTAMVDDLHLVKAVDTDGTVFVVAISNGPNVNAAKE